jgi:hypothetical protein
MSVLTKENLLKPKRRQIVVDIEELGGALKLQEPSAAAVLEIRDLQKLVLAGTKADTDLFAVMVAAIVANDDGSLVFSTEEARQFLSAAPLTAVVKIIEHFNELAGKKKAAVVGVVEGNSEPSQSAS